MDRGETLHVPVEGGTLVCSRWGSGDTVVVAPHGITANRTSWLHVADALGDDVTLVAPDLRGRGDSAGLPGPYGMATHARDCAAVLDHLGVERGVLAGHSMGGFVAVKAGLVAPERWRALLLIDGGIRLPVPEGVPISAILQAVIGPAMERLSMTFPSRDAYLDHWRPHPSFADDWDEVIEAYLDHDIAEGPDGLWRSRVVREVIEADGADSLIDETLTTGFPTVPVPMRFLAAQRGITNADPLYPREVIAATERDVPGFTARFVDDVNHYTIVLGARGAKVVAEEIRAMAESS